MPEVVERIEKKLEKDSIVLFRPLALIPDEGEIRRELMLDDPSLSWVRFRRVGTSLNSHSDVITSQQLMHVEEKDRHQTLLRVQEVL